MLEFARFGALTDKQLRKYQRFSVRMGPKHRFFVPSTFSGHCKTCVNASIFCHQPARNAVIYSVFCFACKNTGICSVLCLSGRKSIGIYSIFCFFASLPQETSKRKNAVIYSIVLLSKSENLSKNAPCRANLGPFWCSCWAILSHLEPS